MIKKYLRGIVEKSAEGKYRVLASTASVDRQGDSIDQSGWDLKNFLNNPVMLWAHKYDELPVAKATSTQETKRGLEMDFEFATEEMNPMAQQIKALYDEGFLSAVSVGFIPKERNGSVITKMELLEVSFVPVPANAEALAMSLKSINSNMLLDEDLKKSLVDNLEKGAVADELDAVESYEMKWEKWDEICEVIGALWDVYFDEATPVESFSALLTEAIGLLQKVADTDGADDDDTVNAGLKEAFVKKVGPEMAKLFVQKMGAKHSSETKKAISSAIDHGKKSITVLEDLMASQDGEDDAEKKVDEPEVEEEEVEGGVELRSLFKSRGLLREVQTDTQSALTSINAFIKSKQTS